MLQIIKSFLKTKAKYGEYDYNTAESLLISDKPYSLIAQTGYDEPEYLQENIMNCVLAYSRHKDTAIALFKDFVAYYERKTGTEVKVTFPPISVSNSFERQMFIAKYLQHPNHSVNDLRTLLWVSERTIADDLARLRGNSDPIQICGKIFSIPDTALQKGKVHFASTAHPLFLTPNLTQIIVTLKGLKAMSEQEEYRSYAIKTAQSIWEQLSDYAVERIEYVFENILPDDLKWYTQLNCGDNQMFYSEYECSRENVFLDCIKNGKTFFAEYDDGLETVFLTNCRFIEGSYSGKSVSVQCDQGTKEVFFDKILRSSYSQEGLL